MMRGENANGSLIGTYRSESYRRKKLSLNPGANGNVDLRLTGRLQNNLDIVEQSNTNFGIFSSVQYAKELSDKYGLESFGLNDADWSNIEDEILFELLSETFNVAYE